MSNMKLGNPHIKQSNSRCLLKSVTTAKSSQTSPTEIKWFLEKEDDGKPGNGLSANTKRVVIQTNSSVNGVALTPLPKRYHKPNLYVNIAELTNATSV